MTINVVIADDSAYLRKNIADILKEHELINIVEYAKDGKEAVKFVKKHNPDVLVLDLLMPKMNGLDAFKLIMEDHPTPTVILSAISPKNLDSSIQALLMGAFDYIIKPGGIGAKELPNFREELLAKVLLASQSQIKKIFQKEENPSSKSKSIRQEIIDDIFDFGRYLNKLKPVDEIEEKSVLSTFDKEEIRDVLKEEIKEEPHEGLSVKEDVRHIMQKEVKLPSKSVLIKKITSPLKKSTAPEYIPDLKPIKGVSLTSNIIVIGASVGGPRTITTILKEIPRTIRAPILIVQHLSGHFTEAFADNLNSECDLIVKVAKHGDVLQNGIAYIAPGENHMEITVENNRPCIKIYKGKPVNFCMPSIDILFYSAAKIYRNRTMGVILTGMGADGVNGLGAIQKIGGKTIAESEETCILYAMPKFATERGFADKILPNYEICGEIIKYAR